MPCKGKIAKDYYGIRLMTNYVCGRVLKMSMYRGFKLGEGALTLQKGDPPPQKKKSVILNSLDLNLTYDFNNQISFLSF